MNELMHVMQWQLMHVMQEHIDACNAIMIFWGTWIGHSSHSP